MMFVRIANHKVGIKNTAHIILSDILAETANLCFISEFSCMELVKEILVKITQSPQVVLYGTLLFS